MKHANDEVRSVFPFGLGGISFRQIGNDEGSDTSLVHAVVPPSFQVPWYPTFLYSGQRAISLLLMRKTAPG